MEIFERLEMHYHLKDGSHSMDAILLNRCESEALAIITETASFLGIDLFIESTAYTEGGIKEIWKFMGKSNPQLTLIVAIIVVLLSRVPVSDSETEELNKKLLKLSVEEKSILVQKLRSEVQKEEDSKELLEAAVNMLQENLKILSRRSNFYRALSDCEKVVGVGATALLDSKIIDHKEYYVGRDYFSRFIFPTSKLPVEIIENASIEIIAPVLKSGNYQWKGNLNGEVITFAMIDEEFKIAVLNGEMVFQHGVVIECVLNVHKKVNEVGDIQTTGYSVPTVVSVINSDSKVETLQGKRYKLRKKDTENQGNLF